MAATEIKWYGPRKCERCGRRRQLACWSGLPETMAYMFCKPCSAVVKVGDELALSHWIWGNWTGRKVGKLPASLRAYKRSKEAKAIRQKAELERRQAEEAAELERRQPRKEKLLALQKIPPVARKLARQCAVRLREKGKVRIEATDEPLYKALLARGFDCATIAATHKAFGYPLPGDFLIRWRGAAILRKLGWRDRKAIRAMPKEIRRDYLIDKDLDSSQRKLICDYLALLKVLGKGQKNAA